MKNTLLVIIFIPSLLLSSNQEVQSNENIYQKNKIEINDSIIDKKQVLIEPHQNYLENGNFYFTISGHTICTIIPCPIPAVSLSRVISTKNKNICYEVGLEGYTSTFIGFPFPALDLKFVTLTYTNPTNPTSSYYGAGFGISSNRLIPVYFTSGLEWYRDTKNPRRFSITFTTSPIWGIKQISKIGGNSNISIQDFIEPTSIRFSYGFGF